MYHSYHTADGEEQKRQRADAEQPTPAEGLHNEKREQRFESGADRPERLDQHHTFGALHRRQELCVQCDAAKTANERVRDRMTHD
jgi:hypothetical protein